MRDFFTSRFATLSQFLQTQHFQWADLKNLFSWQYWTAPTVDATSPEYLTAIVILIILIGLLIFWRSRLKKAQATVPVYQSQISQLANLITFVIIIAATYIFFRAEAINYLSSPLVVLAAIIICVVWLGLLSYQLWRVLPAKRQEYLERERFFRYIPKSKEKPQTKKKN